MKPIDGGVIAADAFLCAAVSAGIKVKADSLDVGIIVSETPAVAAAMFTTNRVAAAPVQLCRQRIAKGRKFRGVVVNAGCANACTGHRGMRDAIRMTELAAECAGARPEELFVASTGVIGRPLPMTKVESGIRAACASLGKSEKHSKDITRAIMTTDTQPKSAAVQVDIAGKPVRIGGIAKGSGMIAPNMATMLSFVTTDAAISGAMLRKALKEVVNRTFNCVTIDGDTSTNDSIFLIANGAAGNRPIRKADRDYRNFIDGLEWVCASLAKLIAIDGEGATRFVEVDVTAARSVQEAKQVAKAIAHSPLVKCAIHGGDPNWGRIICAAGYSGAPVVPEKMKLWINDLLLFQKGMPTSAPEEKMVACMKGKNIRIRLSLGQGKGKATMWTCDFSKEYVAINAEYRT